MEKQWYVVNTYSGHESKVKEKLDSRNYYYFNPEFDKSMYGKTPASF